MWKSVCLWCCFVLVFIAGPVRSAETEDGEAILSPYFLVTSEDSSIEAFPLKKTEANVVISGVIAHVTIKQTYANTGAVAINGRYVFPGSTRAAVHGMTMRIGERIIVARIKEKEEAKKTFEQAKKEGKSASLLEQHRPNVFSMDVANILPGDTIELELAYSELLVPEHGEYSFVFPTVVGPRYSTVPAKGSSPDDQWLKNPYLPENAEPRSEFDFSLQLATGLPLQDVRCESHKVDVAYSGKDQAQIHLKNDGTFAANRDFILKYRLQGEQIASGLLLYKGEKENYFLYVAEPPELPRPEQIPPREYIFVIDVSGSMRGFPLDLAKDLLSKLVYNLKPTDTFNVLLFAGDSRLLSPQSLPVSKENVNDAIQFIDREEGGGGTELLSALNRAMALPRQETVSRSIVVLTDGYVATESSLFQTVAQNLNRANFFTFGIGSSVNRHLIEQMAQVGQGEPFVVTNPADAEEAAFSFVKYISAPLLTNIELVTDDFSVQDLEPPQIADLFAERPVVVFGKWSGEQSGSILLKGVNGQGPFSQKVDVSSATVVTGPGLEYLWARARVARLSIDDEAARSEQNREAISALGLAHNLLTKYTSFVAVGTQLRNEKKARDVSQPLPLPQGVTNAAISTSYNSVPEPGLSVLLVFLLLYVSWHLRRNKKRKLA